VKDHRFLAYTVASTTWSVLGSHQPGAETGLVKVGRLPALIHYRFVNIKAFATPYVMDTFPQFLSEMTPLVTGGKIKYGEEFVEGSRSSPRRS
jgi:NADPH-dependent curcumin reductase CurA